MEKLDRSVWAAGLCIVSYGARVGVRANTPEALELLIPQLPPRWKATTDPIVDEIFSFILGGEGSRPNVRRYHVAYENAGRLARTMDLAEALNAFEGQLHLFVADRARSRIFVHAGVVGWGGRAIVIPGRTHTGKSSLVAALVRAGATYFSDEYAVLDAKGRVHPYPRPLSIRGTDGEAPRRLTAEDLGGRTATASLPVGLVLDTAYRAGVKWRPRRLSPGLGLFSLLNNTVPAQRRPKAVLRTLRATVERAPVLKGARGDAEDVAGEILARMDELERSALDRVE